MIATKEAASKRARRRAIACVVRHCRSHATHRFTGRSGELYFCRFHAGRIHVYLEELIPEWIYPKGFGGIRSD